MKQFAHNDYRLGQNGHVRYYSPKALAQQLSEHGFRIELQTSSEDIITKLLMMKRFNKLAKVSLITKSKFFPMRGECLIVKALKK